MARKLIDISVPLQNDVPADPPGINPTIHYMTTRRACRGCSASFPA